MIGLLKSLFSGFARAAPAPSADLVQTLLTKAQAAREAGDADRALGLYRAVLEQRPKDPGVMALLGNMLKDSGDPEGAIDVYRAILADHPRQADAWLQLGHALKLCGDGDGAQEAYERALLIDPDNKGARAELAAPGLARRQTRQASAMAAGAATDHSFALAAQIDRLEAELARLRQMAGDVADLRHLPPDRFDLFEERYASPRPHTTTISGTLHFLPSADLPPAALHKLVAACQALEISDWTLSAESDEENLRRYAEADPRIRFGAPAAPAPDDWVIFPGKGRPEPGLAAWLAWAGAETSAAAFVFDEVEVDEATEARRLHLREKPDRDALAARPETPSFALRGGGLDAAARDPSDLFASLAAEGQVGHLPIPLFTRDGVMPPVTASDYPLAAAGDYLVRKIAVVIPTNANADLAERFVESLAQKAADPDRLTYVVIDNGAEGEDAVAALDRLRQMPQVTVIADPSPFNWSLLNNRAAEMAEIATCDALVFANDDMLMLSAGWDRRLSAQLSRKDIGVLGARLLFPNDTVQHAGVRLGWRGGSIHDGLHAPRAAPGPGGRWITPHLVSAVTGAFLAVRREVFERLGGFDAKLMPVSHSDLDFCLKARAEGLSVLYDAGIELYHFEGASRGQDAENEVKQARFDAEKRAFEARWGDAAAAEPGLHPFWSEYHSPLTFISQPHLNEIEAYIKAMASADIWRISKPQEMSAPPAQSD